MIRTTEHAADCPKTGREYLRRVREGYAMCCLDCDAVLVLKHEGKPFVLPNVPTIGRAGDEPCVNYEYSSTVDNVDYCLCGWWKGAHR